MVRLKHRYLIGQILEDPMSASLNSLSSSSSSSSTEVEITSRDIQISLMEMIQSLYGDVGTGSFGANTAVKFYDKSCHVYLIRTSREHLHMVQFALTCMNTVKRGGSVVLRTLEIAGSSRTCKVKLLSTLLKCVTMHESISASDKEELQQRLGEQVTRLEI